MFKMYLRFLCFKMYLHYKMYLGTYIWKGSTWLNSTIADILMGPFIYFPPTFDDDDDDDTWPVVRLQPKPPRSPHLRLSVEVVEFIRGKWNGFLLLRSFLLSNVVLIEATFWTMNHDVCVPLIICPTRILIHSRVAAADFFTNFFCFEYCVDQISGKSFAAFYLIRHMGGREYGCPPSRVSERDSEWV